MHNANRAVNHESEQALAKGDSMPSLAELGRNPSLISTLSAPVLVELRRRIGYLAADLDAALYLLTARPRNAEVRPDAEPNQLLTPEAAATRFGVSKRWLLSRADEIPGVKRLSRKTIRFSHRHLARFLEKPV